MERPSAKSNSVIRLETVKKSFRKTFTLAIDHLEFSAGKIHLILGENGAGKSTLLRCIMGLSRYQGSIVCEPPTSIGYAPESYVMPQTQSVEEFLFALGRIRKKTHDEKELVDWLEWFDLTNARTRPIGSLSNGMRQKVNLVQALIHRPSLLLLDEPLKALDPASQKKCVETIVSMRHDSVILVSTHEPELFRKQWVIIHRLDHGRLVQP